jgi:hypothetical protein
MSKELGQLRNSIREIVRQVLAEEKKKRLKKETTTTGMVAGYDTPNAFNANGEHRKSWVKHMAGLTGYDTVNENRYQALRQETNRTPKQKIGQGVREIRKQINEIEKFLEWYGRIKQENNLSGDQFWKRTQSHIQKMNERLKLIREKIHRLRK